MAGDGVCSLREATLYANGTAQPDCALTPPSGTTTIVVPAGTYGLAGMPLTLTGNASISGAGAAMTTVYRRRAVSGTPRQARCNGERQRGDRDRRPEPVGVHDVTLCVGARLPSSGVPGEASPMTAR